jgi:hypothetical protein
MSPTSVKYILGHPDFGYRIIRNHIFSPYGLSEDLITKNSYNKEMPYLILPVLKTSISVNHEIILDLDEAIRQLDIQNANKLSALHYHSVQGLKKLARKPTLFFGFSHQGKELKNRFRQTIKNVNSLYRDPKTGEDNDILLFAIKKNIPVRDKVTIPDIYIYPEIEENPWYVNYRLDDGGIHVSEIHPVLEGYFLETFLKNGVKECHYFPKYTVKNIDHDTDIILHRKNGKTIREGVLDSYSTTRYLYKNRESMLKALSQEKDKLFKRIDIINNEMESQRG